MAKRIAAQGFKQGDAERNCQGRPEAQSPQLRRVRIGSDFSNQQGRPDEIHHAKNDQRPDRLDDRAGKWKKHHGGAEARKPAHQPCQGCTYHDPLQFVAQVPEDFQYRQTGKLLHQLASDENLVPAPLSGLDQSLFTPSCSRMLVATKTEE